MLVCIPTKGNAGLEDSVAEHFGAAPYFTLYDSTTNEIKVLNNRNAHHSHGTCHPMNQLERYQIDAVVCNGMGRRAVEALNAAGVTVYYLDAEQVSDVIEQIKSKKLVEMDPDTACHGHGHGSGGVGGGAGRGGCRHGKSVNYGSGRNRGLG